MWSRRKKNFLLIIEIAISFLVLFAIGSTIIYYYSNFFEEKGFDHENVWELTFDWKDTNEEEARKKMELIKQKILSYPQVSDLGMAAGNVPYRSGSWTTSASNEEGKMILSGSLICGDGFFDLLNIPIIKGRAFNLEDQVEKKQPVIINKAMADILFPNGDAIGKKVNSRKVVGVIGNYRYQSSYYENEPTLFTRVNAVKPEKSLLNVLSVFIKVKPGTGRAFEAKLMDDLHTMTIGWDNDVVWLEDAKKFQDKTTQIPVIIMLIISIFLILNVILGLFGLLAYTINQRKAEFGLRRAIGANTSFITKQVILEALTITSIAVILGLILAIQVPILGIFNIKSGVFILAIFIAMFIIFALVSICAYLPGKQAATIQPASALHEN